MPRYSVSINKKDMKRSKNFTLLVAMACLLLAFSPGCKSKKKAMEASNAEKEKAKIEAEARQKQEEEARRKEDEEREKEAARLREEALAKERENEKTNAPSARLSQYFQSIASSASTQAANNSINEALTLFSSPNVPVLIVISEEAGQKDYDRPTTIKEYLNYLKDQKKNMNSISGLKVDGSGKITEVELRKPL
jgi:hypothetical protein